MMARRMVTILIFAGAASAAAQTPAPRSSAAHRAAAAAPPAAPAIAEPITEVTFAGIQEQTGAFGSAGPAPGGGLAIASPSSLTDTLWISTRTEHLPVAARVTAELEVRSIGAGGLGVAIGEPGDENVVPLLVTVLPGGTVSARDRNGRVVVPPRAIPGGATGPLTLTIDVRGSAVAITANGTAVAQGTAPSLVNGEVHVVAMGGDNFTVRRIRLERLTGIPVTQVALRTSKGMAVPVVRPARFFDTESDRGASVAADSAANTVTITGSPETDFTAFAVRLGILPAAVRIEADVSMPVTCQIRYAGLVFGRRTQDAWFGLLLTPLHGMHAVRIYRMGSDSLQDLSGASIFTGAVATPADRLHLLVEVRGRSVAWGVGDHARPDTVTTDSELSGQFGVTAGPGCTVRYDNLRITPIL